MFYFQLRDIVIVKFYGVYFLQLLFYELVC